MPRCFIAGLVLLPANFEDALDRGADRRLGKRFLDKVDCAPLHRTHRQRYIAVPGNDNDRQRDAVGLQPLLHVQSPMPGIRTSIIKQPSSEGIAERNSPPVPKDRTW